MDINIRRNPPTLEEVALAAGVSRATVSRVANGSRNVNAEMILAVNAAIESLQYVPNRAARSLAERRSMAIALLIPEGTSTFFRNPYFADLLDGITSEIGKSKYSLVLQLATSPEMATESARFLSSGNVDGALLVSHHSGDARFTQIARFLPVVFNGRPLTHVDPEPYFVDVDNVGGAILATRHLLALGRKRIGIISGPNNMPASIDRMSGWRATMEAAGHLGDLVAHGDFTARGGADATRALLQRDPKIDAIFAANDLMAIAALSVLRESGRTVPSDVAVIGFDDGYAASAEDTRLTTIHQPIAEAGRRMAQMLLGLLRGDDVPRHQVLPTYAVVRGTA